jgi:hypothetical protein
MLMGLVLCVYYILKTLDLNVGGAINALHAEGFSKVFFTDPGSKLFFVKQIVAGAFITITMTGMDQEMMQKNISVRTLKDSQKNVITLAVTDVAGNSPVSVPGWIASFICFSERGTVAECGD